MEAERLQALLANIPDVVWTSDSQGRTTFISPNVEQVYGFTPDEILRTGSELWLDRIHPDDVAHVQEAYESLLTQGKVFDVEYRIRHRDGHWIWLHDRATVSYGRDGVKYADGVFSDITAQKEAEAQRDAAREALQRAHDELEQRVSERTAALLEANTRLQAEIAEHKRAEIALQESSARYRGLFADIPVGVYQSTPSGALLNVNPAMVTILGYPDRETLLAANAANLYVNAADRVRWQTLMEHQGTVQDFEIQVRRYDGTVIWVLDAARAVRDGDGRVIYYESSLQDITERKQAEEALWKSGEALRRERNFVSAVLDTVGALVVVLDREGRIVRFNQACENTTGYSFDDVRGQHVWDQLLIPEEVEPVKQVFKDLRSGQFPSQYENDWVARDGERKLIAWTNTALLDDAGSVEHVIGTGVDITERRRAEEALRESLQTAADIVQAIPSGLFIYQYVPPDRLVLLDGNPAAERLTGIGVSNWRGHEFDEIWPQARAAGVTHAYLDVMETGETYATEDLHYADEQLEGAFRIRAFQMPGKRLGVAFENIIERKKAEEALRESETRFRDLFEKAPLCIFELDLTQEPPVVLRANRQATRVYGWSGEEFASFPLPRITPPRAIAELSQVVDALREGRALTVESVNWRRDGSEFPVRISAAAELETDLSRIIVMVKDITMEEERRSEEEAIAEERRRIAREIHDGLAQDLAALRVRVVLWHDLVDGDPAQMHAELDALQSLLRQNIRDVRRSIFALRPIALDELGFYPAIRRFAAEFGEQHQLHVDLQILGPQDRLRAQSEPVLFRIIQEALNNVGKHAQASAAWIELDMRPPADAVRLTVRDDGVGFDPGTLSQAVQRGHVGLTQMRERIEKTGGKLEIESQAGKGTTIRVALPSSGPKGGQ